MEIKVVNKQLRIAERLFPLINDENKIFFSILQIKEKILMTLLKNGKNWFFKILKQKKVSYKLFIWDTYVIKLTKIIL